MEKIVGFDIGESSVKLVYFAGADLKKAVTAELLYIIERHTAVH